MTLVTFAPLLRAQARRFGWPGLVALGLVVMALGLVFVAIPRQEQAVAALRVEADAARMRALRAARVASAASVDVDPAEGFRQGFPAAGSRHERVAALLELASAHGLAGTQSEYRLQVEPALGLARYRVSLPLTGSYPALRDFLAEALRGDPALALDSMRLRRADPQASQLQAELLFSLLMRVDPSVLALPAVLAESAR